ncbi:MAG: hypothetical protein D6812_02125 [Deltaproteobacteria bacterium]|nr:MAG: hypothetical protein D6812_02125 [Deltaproteobacteria bacterium]
MVEGAIMLAFLLLGAGGVYWAMSYKIAALEEKLREAEYGLEKLAEMVQAEREMADLPDSLDALRVLLKSPNPARSATKGRTSPQDRGVGSGQRQSDFALEGLENDSGEST